VVEAQEELLVEFEDVYSSGEWIRFLAREEGDPWLELALEYEVLCSQLDEAHKKIDEIREEKQKLLEEIESLKQLRVQTEKKKGRHWRTFFYEKHPLEEHVEERKRFEEKILQIIEELRAAREKWHSLQEQQDALVTSDAIKEIRQRKMEIEIQAELARLKWIRRAVISTKGLKRAGYRPSAWWFFLLSPSGTWVQETIKRATFYLEHL
jgi:chromosome segregation ATPase